MLFSSPLCRYFDDQGYQAGSTTIDHLQYTILPSIVLFNFSTANVSMKLKVISTCIPHSYRMRNTNSKGPGS